MLLRNICVTNLRISNMKKRTYRIKRVIKKNFRRNIKIFVIVFLFLSLFVYLIRFIGTSVPRHKKGAYYEMHLITPYYFWIKAGKPEDFQNYLDQYNIKYKQNYIYSNIVFIINGENVHTLYTMTNFYSPKNLYTHFVTTDGRIVELYRSGDVRIIKERRNPPIGPPR